VRELRGRPIVYASLFTALVAALVFSVSTDSPAGLAGLFQPGTEGSALEVVLEDFEGLEISPNSGHDGQYFYAIAREPMHLSNVAVSLDRARYRLQRPLFPWLAWALHPFGGGPGLAISMFVVGTASVLLLALTTSRLSMFLGGGWWPAVAVPILPGVVASLLIGVADTLALALVLLSVYLALWGRTWQAAVAGAAAVLTKEALLVILVGQAIARRQRAEIAAAASAAGTAAGWWLFLRVTVESNQAQVIELTWPLGGLVDSTSYWMEGTALGGAFNYLLIASSVAAALIVTKRTHPLLGGFIAFAAFATLLGKHVVGPGYNGTRTLMPALVLSLLLITTRRATGPSPTGEPNDRVGAAGER
jgi:hypothetical protein